MEAILLEYIVKRIHSYSALISVILISFSITNVALSESKKKNDNNTPVFNIKEILSDRVLGKANAEVTIIEYASMTCPHCADFHNGPLQSIKKEYIDKGKVKFIYRDYPLDRLALAAAMMARCAPKERYYAIVNIIYKTQSNWRSKPNPNQALSRLGLLAGITKNTYEACISNRRIFDGIMKARSHGEKKFDLKSTPTIIINNKKVSGSLTIKNLREIIDKILE